MTWLVAFLLCVNAPNVERADKCDVIELNQVIRSDGTVGLSQYIFWQFLPGRDRAELFAVRDWKYAEACELWEYENRDGCWVTFERYDVRVGVFCRRRPIITKTWHDPERQDCEYWPEEKRRRLFR